MKFEEPVGKAYYYIYSVNFINVKSLKYFFCKIFI